MSSNNIKPSKYPVGPDEQEALYDQAVAAGRAGKQDTLVSGTNIKTINGASVLGAGDLTVSGSGASWGSITGTLSSQTDLSTALSGKEPTITAGTTAQYYRGDKTFQALDSTAVGLGNVDNTSDANKPISTATQTALNAKQDTLVSGTSIKTINSASILSSGNINLPQILYSNHTILSLSGITTEYLKASVPIPTTIGNSMLRITFIAQCLVLGTTGPRSRIRIGTVATPSNAQLTASSIIATNAVGSAGTVSLFRNMTVTGGASGSILGASFSGNILSDQNMTTTYNTQNVNWTTQQYLYFTIQNNATNTTTQIASITVELL